MLLKKHNNSYYSNYLNIRLDEERLFSIHWLIVKHLNNILPEQSRRAKSSNELIYEREEIVANYSEKNFSTFNKYYILILIL